MKFELFKKYISERYELTKRFFYKIEDLYFEKKYGLDLGGVIYNYNLDAINSESLLHATAYQAVWNRNVNELICEAEKLGANFENFIDIGSGKGKACLYAYKLNRFKKIIGVEFSNSLTEIANNNKMKMNANEINFILGDAREYHLPKEHNLIFMFNPFDGNILREFIVINYQLIKETKSIIAYANDVHRDVFSEFGFLTIFRNVKRGISLYKLV